MLTLGPLRLRNVTGSPVNPIALFEFPAEATSPALPYDSPGMKGFTIDKTIEAAKSNAPTISTVNAGAANPWVSCWPEDRTRSLIRLIAGPGIPGAFAVIWSTPVVSHSTPLDSRILP